MTFTDDDLKRLKVLAQKKPLVFERNSIGYWTVRDSESHLKIFDDLKDQEALLLRYATNDLPALLNRLEAAERLIPRDIVEGTYIGELHKAWQKAKGEDPESLHAWDRKGQKDYEIVEE